MLARKSVASCLFCCSRACIPSRLSCNLISFSVCSACLRLRGWRMKWRLCLRAAAVELTPVGEGSSGAEQWLHRSIGSSASRHHHHSYSEKGQLDCGTPKNQVLGLKSEDVIVHRAWPYYLMQCAWLDYF